MQCSGWSSPHRDTPSETGCSDQRYHHKNQDAKQALIDYWRGVRAKTVAYLDRITDADLKEVPGDEFLLGEKDPNRQNPRREWFVMTIQHQHYHWGELSAVGKLLAHDRSRND